MTGRPMNAIQLLTEATAARAAPGLRAPDLCVHCGPADKTARFHSMCMDCRATPLLGGRCE